jgi:GT2 family glycosyltransferase/glycosyltransferase involved in cell wall biosynthesis
LPADREDQPIPLPDEATEAITAGFVLPELVAAAPLFSLEYIARRHSLSFATVDAAMLAYTNQGFDPSSFFIADLYQLLHPDIRRKKLDCLLHYLQFGRSERRTPHPLFDPSYVLAQLAGRDRAIDDADVYLEFLDGAIDVSPHKAISLDYVRRAAGKNLSALEIFSLFADPDVALPLSPHPLFDVRHYRAFNDLRCRNEIIDYLAFRDAAKSPSALFDDVYYSVSGALATLQVPPLIHYLDHWHEWTGQPSLLVDLQHLYRELGAARINAAIDPVSSFVTEDEPELSCHPDVIPGMIGFAFANHRPDHHPQATLTDVLAKLPEIYQGVMPDHPAPELSVVILNYRRPVLTFLAVCAALNALRGWAADIVVIENGGEPFDFEALAREFRRAPAVRLIKLKRNRFFGEGNNIGIDVTRGRHVLFLNNDCFLAADFGEALRRQLAQWPEDCVGACLFFPNGMIQEFGALVSDYGDVVQRGKRLSADFLTGRMEPEEVDYTSAACVVFPRDLLRRLGGFDPAFEPFFYEDTDLMRRVRAAGRKVMVSPRLRAVHIENASTAEFLGDGLHAAIQVHRSLYARRWLRHQGLSTLGVGAGEPADAACVAAPRAAAGDRPTVVMYTPFDIMLGGGERYFLSAASALSRHYDVTICSEVDVSTARIRFALNALGVQAFSFRVAGWDEVLVSRRPDLLFAMGNEVVPPVPPIGQRNWFHLQFPFPWRNVPSTAFARIDGFERIVVNSDFTAGWTARRLREFGVRRLPEINVIHPSSRLPGMAPGDDLMTRGSDRDFLSVVNVGRLFVGGHSKRQDIFLDIIEEANRQANRPIRGTLIGTLFDDPQSKEFLESLESRTQQSGLVRILLDASEHELLDELRSADVYLHCAGYEVSEQVFPERLEHFGIAVVDGIFAGCYPVLYDAGGPGEILRKGGVGRGFGTIREAAEVLATFSSNPERYREEFARAGADWFAGLTDAGFHEQILALLAAGPG